MRKIIAGLDIGTNELKLVVGEILKNKLNILACVETKSRGIKKGYVVNNESAMEAFLEIFKKAEEIIGIPIKKVICIVPSLYVDCFLAEGAITIKNENRCVTHKEIIKVLQAVVYNKVVDNRELVTILPTGFRVDDGEVVANPLNLIGERFSAKGVIVTIPKKNIEGISHSLRKIGIELVDVVISPLADYYEFANKDINKQIGALVNIGECQTIVSIFNKSILTSCEVIDIGANQIDNDLCYVYKISNEDARYLKEHLCLAHTRMAQPNEALTFSDKHGEAVKINQYDASEIANSRLNEIMNLIKKQINLLTKKEISYIIVTGGITELQDFDILLESHFGNMGYIGNVEEIGARNNKYSSAVGLIKYYYSRLKLRNTEFSIFNLDEQEELGGLQKKVNISENSLLGKLFGYFFDN